MKRILSLIALASLSLTPVAAFANEEGATVTAGVGVKALGITAGAQATTTLEVRAKGKADQEIDRRISTLNVLSARIDEMKRVSSSVKTSLKATIAAEISALTTLRATIDAETVLDNLKAEIKSITQEYRIYALVIPQIRIAASSDRIQGIVGAGGYLDVAAAKVEARLNATTTASSEALKKLDTEMRAKMAEANTLAQAAVTLTASLKPDNGDVTIAASNKAAIEDARGKIKAATADVNAAVATLHKIIAGLKVKGNSTIKVHATSTTESQ